MKLHHSILIEYVRYVAETNIIEDILFCNPIPGKAISNEIFNVIDTFFDENDIKCTNCIGHSQCLQARPVFKH